MKKDPVFILVSVLILSSLILAACSPSGGTSAGKGGGETPTAAAVNGAEGAYPGQAGQSGAPTQAVAYPAGSGPQDQPTAAAQPYPAQTAEAPPAALSIAVVKADGTTTTLAAADLQKLSPAQVTIGQSDQSGYKLSDVLTAAGVSSFQQVVVTGASGSATLSQADVTADVILSTVDPASLTLTSPTLTGDKAVKGVNKIEVK
jgi:hypothetical protein